MSHGGNEGRRERGGAARARGKEAGRGGGNLRKRRESELGNEKRLARSVVGLLFVSNHADRKPRPGHRQHILGNTVLSSDFCEKNSPEKHTDLTPSVAYFSWDQLKTDLASEMTVHL